MDLSQAITNTSLMTNIRAIVLLLTSDGSEFSNKEPIDELMASQRRACNREIVFASFHEFLRVFAIIVNHKFMKIRENLFTITALSQRNFCSLRLIETTEITTKGRRFSHFFFISLKFNSFIITESLRFSHWGYKIKFSNKKRSLLMVREEASCT